jgi:hypothetical protein
VGQRYTEKDGKNRLMKEEGKRKETKKGAPMDEENTKKKWRNTKICN